MEMMRFLSDSVVPHRNVSVSRSVLYDPVQPRELQPASPLCPWDFPGKNSGAGCHFLLQGIFLTQGLNLGLLHYRPILYHLRHQGLIEFYFTLNKYKILLKTTQSLKTCLHHNRYPPFLRCVSLLVKCSILFPQSCFTASSLFNLIP